MNFSTYRSFSDVDLVWRSWISVKSLKRLEIRGGRKSYCVDAIFSRLQSI